MSKGLKITLIVVAVIAVIVFMAGGWLMRGYNNVVTMDEEVKNRWAQVDNQLKRRYDLIPNLVETVKGYATHERETFEKIAEYRTQYFQQKSIGGKINASNQLEGVLSRLLMLQESFPQLKANESFLKLQDSLEGTENRIAVERMRYNESVKDLNAYTRTVFGGIFAALARVEKAPYYEVPEAEKAVPKVQFNK